MTSLPSRALAVDGGQSTVRVRHSNGATGEAPGVSWGAGDAVAASADAVVSAWRAAGSPATEVAVLGLTTVPPGADEGDRLARLVAEEIGADHVIVCDDGITAHAGALGGSWGVVLAIGTGVACVARTPGGRTKLIGGHGYLVGDEGGAFWIGRTGLAAALRATEGRGEPTALTTLAESAFGDLAGAHIRIHADPRAVDRIARFAPSVVRAAREGDTTARSILEDALAELVECARAGWVAAGGEANTPLAVIGRLADELRPELDGALAALDGFDLRSAVGGPLDGAAHLTAHAADYGTAVHTWTRG
jgi:N-acetylglucosamine kinase-like BadF-type ATPase